MSSAGQLLVSMLAVVGSLAVFSLGIGRLTEAVLRTWGDRFGSLLRVSEDSAAHAMLRGIAAGSMTGSPVSGMVLLVSMVDTGAVAIKRLPLVLAGINLGASLFGWVLVVLGFLLPVQYMGLAVLAVALPYAVSTGIGEKNRGDILIGIGLLMLGIHLLTSNLLHDNLLVLTVMSGSGWAWVASLLVGACVAAAFRSPVTAAAAAMALAYQGLLTFELSAMVLIGGNLGIAVVGLLASVSYAAHARQAALLHLLVQLLGSVWLLLLFPAVLSLVKAALPGMAPYSLQLPLRLALLQSTMHAGTLLLILPISRYMVCAVGKMTAQVEPDTTDAAFSLNLLPLRLPQSLDANLLQTQGGLAQMADIAREMLMMVMNTSQLRDNYDAAREDVQQKKMQLTRIRSEISQALTVSVQQQCSQIQAQTIQLQQRIAHEMKGIGDDCARIMAVLSLSYKKQYRFHDESRDELFGFSAQVLDFLQYNSDYLQGRIATLDWKLAQSMETGIDAARDKLKKRSRKYLEKNPEAQVKGELAFIEIVGHLEHIGDGCMHVSHSVAKLRRACRQQSGDRL